MKNKICLNVSRLSLYVITLMSLFLAGCSSSGLMSAHVKMNAAQYLNPDVNGQASPVMVSFYELTTPVAFKQANYFQLEKNAGSVLGEALLDKQSVAMRPGSSITYKLTMPSTVKYVGVTAGYRNIDQANWRAVFPVDKKPTHWYTFWSSSIDVRVDLHSQGIDVQPTK